MDEGYYQRWIPEFDLRSISLTSLASGAAVDISNFRLAGKEHDAPVKYLSRLLNDLTQGENPRGELLDIGSVLAYAVSGREEFTEYWKGKNPSEILVQLSLVSKDLRDFKSLSEERQETLENFCVNLSRELMCYHSQYSRAARLAA